MEPERDRVRKQRRVREVKMVKVIRVTYLQGSGADDDIAREVVGYYTKDGELIGNDDTFAAPLI